jgi:hypothetical protein
MNPIVTPPDLETYHRALRENATLKRENVVLTAALEIHKRQLNALMPQTHCACGGKLYPPAAFRCPQVCADCADRLIRH